MILKPLFKGFPWTFGLLKKLFLTLILTMGLSAFSQSFSDNLTQIREIPTTPTMWEFEKYGNYPVSMYTGVPNVSIPLFTARSGEMAVPVSLNYHASGIKVNQKATWVGLGWSLMAGGAITRTVRGSVDEGNRGYIDNSYYDQGQFDPAFGDNYYEMEEMLQGYIDTEPDIFHYNFMGYSGRFIFDHSASRNTATISLIPYNDLIVEPIFSNSGMDIISFTITTPEGYVAEFAYPERSSEYRGAGLIGDLTVTANSTWHLKNITGPNGVDEISFEYKLVPGFHESSSGMASDKRFSQTRSENFYDPCNLSNHSNGGYDSNNGIVFYGVKRLERINFHNGYIYFGSSSGNRQDDPDNESLRLDQVQLYSSINGTDTLIKRFQFQYGYFGTINEQNATPDEFEVRLKLEQLIEKGPNEISKNPHEFSYLEAIGNHDIPALFSTAQDYWGYYNGNNSPSLVPSYTWNNQINLGDANRAANPTVSKMGVLEKIVYPTKGYTEFEFEGNSITTNFGEVEHHDVGGLRVKAIKSFDFDDSLQWQKYYEYVKPDENTHSSGVYNDRGLMDDSNFVNVRTYHFKSSQVGSCPPSPPMGHSTFTVNVSSYPMDRNTSAAVYYSNVKEYNGSPESHEGYTWYTYSTTKDVFSNVLGPIYFSVDRSWDRGQLLLEEVFENDNNNPIKTVTYNYEEEEVREPISAFKPGTRFDVEGIGYYPPGIQDPYGFRSQQYFLAYYIEPVVWKRLASKITEENGITFQENYFYDNEIDHTNLVRTEATDSKANINQTKMYYPDDVFDPSAMEGGKLSPEEYSAINSLKRNALNSRVGQVIQTVKTNNGNKSIERTNFNFWNDNMVLPTSVETSKGTQDLDTRFQFHNYDNEGNLLEVSQNKGSHIYYVWGYNKQFPIAKIENLSSGDIENDLQDLINAAETASNADDSEVNENALRTALDNLRSAVTSALITTYTYDPQVGVTSITDSRGNTTHFEYDELSRLKNTKDKELNLLTEYQYNYKDQEELDAIFLSLGVENHNTNDTNVIAHVNGGSGQYEYQWSVKYCQDPDPQDADVCPGNLQPTYGGWTPQSSVPISTDCDGTRAVYWCRVRDVVTQNIEEYSGNHKREDCNGDNDEDEQQQDP